MAIDNKKKALIHIAKSQTGMSEVEYRALLSGFGVASSKDLAPSDFSDVMRHFETLGFKSTSKYYRPAGGKKRLMSKIIAIRDDLGLHDSYIDGMAKNMFNVDSYRWLDADQLHRLVAALTYHQRRQERSQ